MEFGTTGPVGVTLRRFRCATTLVSAAAPGVTSPFPPGSRTLIRLTLLGAVAVAGVAEPARRALVSQPKRLALLAYLAVRADALHSRDELVELFWRDSDPDRGRAALRKALHFLREQLGPDIILAAPTHFLALSHDRITSDVRRFEALIRQGEHAAALALYRGDLLAGYWLSDAPGFEQWLTSAQRRLRDMASAAALHLASEELRTGNIAMATFWAHRAEEFCPANEQISARVIELLDAAGDRAAALDRFDALRERLRRDFDVDPSPETRRVVEDIRQRQLPTDRHALQRRMRTPIAGVQATPATLPPSPASHSHLEALLDASDDAVITADRAGTVIYANRGASRMLGWSLREIIGRPCLDLIRAERRADAAAAFVRRAAGVDDPASIYMEVPAVAAGGRTIWLGVRVNLVRHADGTTVIAAIGRELRVGRQPRLTLTAG